MKAVLSTKKDNKKKLVEKAKKSKGLEGVDLVKEVTCGKAYKWENKGMGYRVQGIKNPKPSTLNPIPYKVVVIDCGVKYSILNNLASNGCDVTVVPAKTTAKKILSYDPDGIVVSNGPGDPAAVTYVIQTVKELIRLTVNGKRLTPILGICLGQQILGIALGGKTYKLKFGHHGGNHPVKDLRTGKIAITSQNHGFCVDIDSLKKQEIEITHMNLYDNTLEGIRHKKLPIFSVQYHPEAGPGPHDARYLFSEFVAMMNKNSL